MGTQKRILDRLIEMSKLCEIERKTSISVRHMQVFEYLTTFSKGLTKTYFLSQRIKWSTLDNGCTDFSRLLKPKIGIPVVCEVFNQFSDCIPQEALSRIERGRHRQGLVRDFKMPGEQGEGDILCEVKCMSASKSRYPQNPRQGAGTRAVDRRADGLTADYTRKAREMDHQHCGVPRPPPARDGEAQPPRQVGPVERRLQGFGRVRGWCFGAW